MGKIFFCTSTEFQHYTFYRHDSMRFDLVLGFRNRLYWTTALQWFSRSINWFCFDWSRTRLSTRYMRESKISSWFMYFTMIFMAAPLVRSDSMPCIVCAAFACKIQRIRFPVWNSSVLFLWSPLTQEACRCFC